MEISLHNTESFGGSNPNGYDNQESSISSVSELPSFIIFEILLKLPIKSIIRCRLVCRTWNNLISEKYFATLYLKNPPFNILVKSECIMVDGIVRYSFKFLEIGLNGDITPTPFNPKALNFKKSGWVLDSKGSCNGLLCLVQSPRVEFQINWEYVFNNEIVYIVNPILGEVTLLPQVNQTEDTTSVYYGFGFSTHSERYKVLRLVSRKRDGHRHGEIFTIGVDHKWRYVEDSSWLPFEVYPWGISLNGLLYFASNIRLIFAFDIEEERGHQISYPSQLFGHPGLTALGVCNGNICLYDNSTKHQLVIWTMKRYGDDVESWSRETILKSWIPFNLGNDQLIPIATLRNGDLLLSRFSFFSSEGLISYNPKTKECRKITDHEVATVMLFDFVPSFFSLNTNL